MRKDLKIKVKSIKGICSVYKPKTVFFIRQGYILDAVGQNICMHALCSLTPFYNTLSLENISPSLLGLGKRDKAYIQCPEACDLTGGGTVLFEIEKI
jgi:uncharacterized repeat protein (TIGR04076 family)